MIAVWTNLISAILINHTGVYNISLQQDEEATIEFDGDAIGKISNINGIKLLSVNGALSYLESNKIYFKDQTKIKIKPYEDGEIIINITEFILYNKQAILHPGLYQYPGHKPSRLSIELSNTILIFNSIVPEHLYIDGKQSSNNDFGYISTHKHYLLEFYSDKQIRFSIIPLETSSDCQQNYIFLGKDNQILISKDFEKSGLNKTDSDYICFYSVSESEMRYKYEASMKSLTTVSLFDLNSSSPRYISSSGTFKSYSKFGKNMLYKLNLKNETSDWEIIINTTIKKPSKHVSRHGFIKIPNCRDCFFGGNTTFSFENYSYDNKDEGSFNLLYPSTWITIVVVICAILIIIGLASFGGYVIFRYMTRDKSKEMEQEDQYIVEITPLGTDGTPLSSQQYISQDGQTQIVVPLVPSHQSV